jgi:hypothetical protein
MALQQNTAEGQASGTIANISNTGGGSGNAFGLMSAGNVVFSNVQAAHNTQSYRIQASAGTAIFAGLTVGTPVSAAAVRYYLYLNAYPAVSLDSIVQIRATSGRTTVMGLTTDGRLSVYDNTGTVLQTAPLANAVPLNTWVRIELRAVVGTGATDGTIAAAYYLGDSNTAQWSYASTTVNAGTNLITEGRFGRANATGDINAYMDDLAFNDGLTSFIGPAAGNVPPVANAGADQTVVTGAAVTLDGSASTDSDGTIASYTWTQLSGTAVTLSGSGATRTFTAPGSPTTLLFSLTVTDNSGAPSDPSTVTITVGDTAAARILLTNSAEGGANGVTFTTAGGQAADSGNNFDSVYVGTGSTLSYSTDQAILGTKSYKMVQGTGSVILSWSTSLAGVAPVNDFVFQGYVYITATPTGTLTLYKGYADLASSANMASWAVTMNTSRQIVVQNSTSNLYTLAPVLALNTWYRVEGEFVASTSSQVKVSVGTSTNVYAYGSSSTFSANQTVSVRQGIASASSGVGTAYFDDFTVAVGPGFLTQSVFGNQPPTASAGSDQTNIEPWSTVTLAGTDSDADGTVVTRTWRQISGPAVTLSATGNTATYAAPATITGGTLVFGYQVIDNSGAPSAESTVTHTVLPATERVIVGGVEVPVRFNHVSSAGSPV